MLTTLIVLAFLGSLIGIAVIARRHLSQAASMDVSRLKDEVMADRKTMIIQERLERKAKTAAQRLTPAVQAARKGFHSLYGKLRILEEDYRKKLLRRTGAHQQASHELMREAENLHEGEKYSEAEKKYIELISINPKNLEAFRGLAELYVQQRKNDQAVETYQYCVQIGERELAEGKTNGITIPLASDYADLGIAQKELGNNEDAVSAFERAVQLESANPRYLDLLLQTSILIGDKVRAWGAFDKLKGSNPENQRLVQYQHDIDELDKKTRMTVKNL